MNLNEKSMALIKTATKKRDFIKFTIGTLKDGETSFKLFDSAGEIPYVSQLYEIGSIGKVFTASLLSKYLEKGMMNLDDSVAKYVPELDDDKYYPTLRRLITHTSGIPNHYPMMKAEYKAFFWKSIGALLKRKQMPQAEPTLMMDFDKMIRIAKEIKVENKNYKWAYSNYGISLLGHAVSNVAEKPFWALMDDYLKQDLGLDSTFMGMDHPDILSGYNAKGYHVGNFKLRDESYTGPAGYLTSNAEDMLDFAKLHLAENPSHLALTHEFHDMNDKHSHMGLGWWIKHKNQNIYYHGGNTDGFASMLAFDKQKKTAVVILTNIQFYHQREKLFMEILENL
jgi:CubicO group peptidase (beta-lactamase class C family)